MAFADLRASTQRIGLAWSLAWHDIVSRYRGSMLGPFWITLSMGLMVAGIGFLYANLFKVPVNEFIPYVALGIVFWGDRPGPALWLGGAMVLGGVLAVALRAGARQRRLPAAAEH